MSDLSNGNIITFPYVGYIDVSGDWQYNILGNGIQEDEYKQDEVVYPAVISFSLGGQPLQIQGGTGKKDANAEPRPHKFRNIKYKVVDREVVGNLWSRNPQNNKLIYGYKDQGIQITEYSLNVGTWENKKLLVVFNYHQAKYEDKNWKDYKIEDRALSDEELEELLKPIESQIRTNSIFSGGWGDVLGNILDELENSWASNAIFKKETDTSVAAYNVRCVKE